MAKKQITITLYMSEIFYPVENKTYLTGRSRSDGTNHEEVANMQANDDEENANQVLDSIGNAFATLKTKLSQYIVVGSTTADNILLSKDTDLILSLSMPGNYNQANNDTLARAASQFIVNTAIADWFTITNKSDADDYAKSAAANLELLREAVSQRLMPTRGTPKDGSQQQTYPQQPNSTQQNGSAGEG